MPCAGIVAELNVAAAPNLYLAAILLWGFPSILQADRKLHVHRHFAALPDG